MTPPKSLALTRIAEILDRANNAASEFQEAAGQITPISDSLEAAANATVRAQNVLIQVQSLQIAALREIVGVLARDIDELRQEIASLG
jgi:hypothetical protein